jgi:hypothetical protein
VCLLHASEQVRLSLTRPERSLLCRLVLSARLPAVETSLACTPALSITLHRPVTQHYAVHACRLPSAKPFVLAQRYVSNPLLFDGCKFGIRLWLLVTGVDPFTCYLHKQGLVLFSTDGCGQTAVELLLQQLLLFCTSTAPVACASVYSLTTSGRLWVTFLLAQPSLLACCTLIEYMERARHGILCQTRHLHAAGSALRPCPCCCRWCCCCCCCSYDMGSLSDDEGAAARGHITNYAQNVNGIVWSLDMLKEHLGEQQGRPHCAAAKSLTGSAGNSRQQVAKSIVASSHIHATRVVAAERASCWAAICCMCWITYRVCLNVLDVISAVICCMCWITDRVCCWSTPGHLSTPGQLCAVVFVKYPISTASAYNRCNVSPLCVLQALRLTSSCGPSWCPALPTWPAPHWEMCARSTARQPCRPTQRLRCGAA